MSRHKECPPGQHIVDEQLRRIILECQEKLVYITKDEVLYNSFALQAQVTSLLQFVAVLVSRATLFGYALARQEDGGEE